jgi:hypothetical protein
MVEAHFLLLLNISSSRLISSRYLKLCPSRFAERIIGHKREEETGEWKKSDNEWIHNHY